MGLPRHPALPGVSARAVRIARGPRRPTRATCDVSDHREGYAAADGYQSRQRRDCTLEDDGRDGSAGERGTALRLPGRRTFLGRRSYGGGPAFAAGQTAGVSVQSRGAAAGAGRENQGIAVDPSGVSMDAANLSAASRRVGRSRGECRGLAEQGGWRQDRDRTAAVAPPVVVEKAAGKAREIASQIDAGEMPRRLAAQSSRRLSAVCSPGVPTLSGCRKSPPTPASLIPPSCITSAAARAW